MKRWQTILLVLSMILNFGVIGSFIYLKYIKYPVYFRDTVKLVSDQLPTGKKMALAGDSFAAKHHWNRLDSVYSVAVYGLGGSTINDWESRIVEVISENPERILLWLGINDLLRGGNPDSIAENYMAFSRMISLKSTAEINIVSVFPVTTTFPQSPAINKNVERLNKLLSNGKATNFRFLSMTDHFVDSEGALSGVFSTDGLHLNEWGYDLAELILIKKLSEASN